MSGAAAKPIRSPSYPSTPLREAVEQIAKIESKYRASPVDRAEAAKLIGYSSLSGPANMALASLAAYGLLERAGKGEARATERARSILHPNSSTERSGALRDAALEPPLYKELRERFRDIPIPPEEGVMNFLNRQGFNPNAVKPAAKSFTQTMSYIEELGASDSNSHATRSDPDSHGSRAGTLPPKFGGAKIGDLIQWEADGVLRMEKPMRVRAVSEDAKWVAVDGSETGIPMSEVIIEERTTTEPPRFPLPAKDDSPLPAGTRRAVFDLAEGEVTLQFPEDISAASVEDLEGYLEVFLRKTRRAAKMELKKIITPIASQPPS